MLNSLKITNYRILKELRIESLKRVNLITGKNNTGKSTILEALALYSSKGDIGTIFQFLIERGEDFSRERNYNNRILESNPNTVAINLKSLSSIFSDRESPYTREGSIVIGSMEQTLFGIENSFEDSLRIRFVKYIDETERDSHGVLISRKRSILDGFIGELENYKIGFEIKYGNNQIIHPLDEERIYRLTSRNVGDKQNFQFIRTRNIDKEINGNLWDNITLTQKELYVTDALRIIEPSVERIAFVGDNTRERTAVIKLSGNTNPLPLRSMGDGINRILTIILALVNCDHGFLFIDEFENGLHHTVQEKLWDIIFKLSKDLNIQVFATTHSEDCIKGFENSLNKANDFDGQLIRLDNHNGILKLVEYNAEELKIATDFNIETR